MASKTEYLELVAEQKQTLRSGGEKSVGREAYHRASQLLKSDNRVLVITGMRRVGKSTLLNQLLSEVNNYSFLNFEDEKLMNFKIEDFNLLNEALIEIYGESDYFFFDEIQNVEGFEVIVRKLQDSGKKVIITGSNSSLLSMEFGTKLTGRYVQIELFPFSFAEYLKFKKIKLTKESFLIAQEKVKLKVYFKKWLESGGMPEYLKYKDVNYLRTLYDNILYRDVIARFNIRRQSTFKELVHTLVNNLTLPVTFNALKNNLGLSNAETAKEYVHYLTHTYFFYELFCFSNSYKAQLRSPRKVYLIDNAFHSMISFSSSENRGRKLENIVHLYYRKTAAKLFYFKEKGECDFVAFNADNTKELVQVCYEITAENKTREINGLVEAMAFFKENKGKIITYDQEEVIKLPEGEIEVVPAWKFFSQEINY